MLFFRPFLFFITTWSSRKLHNIYSYCLQNKSLPILVANSRIIYFPLVNAVRGRPLLPHPARQPPPPSSQPFSITPQPPPLLKEPDWFRSARVGVASADGNTSDTLTRRAPGRGYTRQYGRGDITTACPHTRHLPGHSVLWTRHPIAARVFVFERSPCYSLTVSCHYARRTR